MALDQVKTDVLSERPEVLLGERKHNVHEAVQYMALTVDRLEVAAGEKPIAVPMSQEVKVYAEQASEPLVEVVQAEPRETIEVSPRAPEPDTEDLMSIREQVSAAYANPLLNEGQQ